ncbi:MAG: hypothetical protein KAQ85_00170 [Thermodesulfovibrionia bacterium]|nr:hypothetical protein [Thermodesulfovibrionia bacterium]
MNLIHGLIFFGIFLVVSIGGASAECNETIPQELIEFLETDITNEHEYLPWYTCGHFTRSLAHNASEHNISMGAAILSNHPVFRGKWNSHIINYIDINGTMYFIEPRHDYIMKLDEVFMTYRFIRLYLDGTQVPSNWDCNLAPTLRGVS